MIQRIQTVYLVLGAVALATLLLFDSVWESTVADAFSWYAPVLVVLVLGTAAMALFAVFQYKKRERQLRTVVWVQMATVLVAVVYYGGLFFMDEFSVLTEGGGTDVEKLVTLLLPAVAYVLFLLARRGIRADIALVRSMDRLR